MEKHNHNLNIHYSLPVSYWERLNQLYTEMPYWSGYQNGCPTWHANQMDQRIIQASVEASGLSFYAELPTEEWLSWFQLFQEKATQLLGYAIGEPEAGFEFLLLD